MSEIPEFSRCQDMHDFCKSQYSEIDKSTFADSFVSVVVHCLLANVTSGILLAFLPTLHDGIGFSFGDTCCTAEDSHQSCIRWSIPGFQQNGSTDYSSSLDYQYIICPYLLTQMAYMTCFSWQMQLTLRSSSIPAHRHLSEKLPLESWIAIDPPTLNLVWDSSGRELQPRDGD